MRSRKSLIKEADRVFSLYVRNRGASFLFNHCFTCRKYLPVNELQAGHFIRRNYHNVRWHPVNVWPQCNKCNVEKSGNLVVYEAKLAGKFGEEIIDALWELARENNGGLDDHEIREIINKYK